MLTKRLTLESSQSPLLFAALKRHETQPPSPELPSSLKSGAKTRSQHVQTSTEKTNLSSALLKGRKKSPLSGCDFVKTDSSRYFMFQLHSIGSSAAHTFQLFSPATDCRKVVTEKVSRRRGCEAAESVSPKCVYVRDNQPKGR